MEEGCGELVRLRGLEVGGPCGFGSRFKRVAIGFRMLVRRELSLLEWGVLGVEVCREGG